jgi:hypothetical protein
MVAVPIVVRREMDQDAARKRGSGVPLSAIGYLVGALAIVVGWMFRTQLPYTAERGLGYWLGIVGASLMAALLLYPLRKKFSWLTFLGATRHWFRLHMLLGVVGPILILYHCRFDIGALNSRVALLCTLTVAVSGLIGRYLYAKVHAGLYGHKLSLEELRRRVQAMHDQENRAEVFLPQLMQKIQLFDQAVLIPPASLVGCLLVPLHLGPRTRMASWRLRRYARRQLRLETIKSPALAARHAGLERAMSAFIAEHLRRVRRLAEFNSYERLLGLWHLFHLPFFYMLVLTALLHVLAVHMY